VWDPAPVHAFVDRPKVVLHDHLDGGVRAATVIELAAEAGVELPTEGVGDLMRWFTIRPDMGLVEAFSRFDLVISVLRTADGLRRVAREAVEDLAADGVIHAELRFAPLAHTGVDLDADTVIEAVLAGVEDASGTACTAGVIVCGLREQGPEVSLAAARLAARWAGRGVVGFDLAGAEVGNPASAHREAFAVARDGGLGLTAHAGEMDGVGAVTDALDAVGPDRLGHGWRLVDDCIVEEGRIVELGPTAARVRDDGIPLEICLTSNACLGLPVERHPARMLFDAGFALTLNPDDRSITTTSTSREHDLASRVLGFSSLELAALNERAAIAAFLPPHRRDELAQRVRAGWKPYPARLVHLAEADRWRARAGGPYLPVEFDVDGFIHLSALHQVLTPANRFYRGRRDLTAVVLDARVLGDAVVWEAGTGTEERFPHLYGAITPDAVVAEVDLAPGPDGGFLLPSALVGAAAG
jgi:adenosine deaminase